MAVFRGLVLLRFGGGFGPSHVCGGFVFTFLALRLALGLVAVAVVSHRLRVWRWVILCAVVSCLCLIIRVCHATTILLN